MSQKIVYKHIAKQVVAFREAAKVMSTMKEYDAEVEIIRGTKTGTSKSILSIIALGINYGNTVVIKAEGKEAEAAVRALIKLL